MLCKCGCGQKTPLAKSTRYHLGYFKGEPVNYIQGHNRRGHQSSDEHRQKISEANKGALSSQWKGDSVGYIALHQWLYRNKKRKGICEECGKKGKTDFANVSGEYKRDVDDFIELCRSCHCKRDDLVRNFYAVP